MSVNGTVDEFLLSTVADIGNVDIATIDLQTDLADLGIDSISRVLIVRSIENKFSLNFSLEQILDLFKVNQIKELAELTVQFGSL